MKKAKWKKEQKEYKPDPLFDGMPENLKDPACYEEVLKGILKAGESGHEHRYMITWTKCKHCQQKFYERKVYIAKLGFSSYEQFLQWRRVMDVIINQREIRIPAK